VRVLHADWRTAQRIWVRSAAAARDWTEIGDVVEVTGAWKSPGDVTAGMLILAGQTAVCAVPAIRAETSTFRHHQQLGTVVTHRSAPVG